MSSADDTVNAVEAAGEVGPGTEGAEGVRLRLHDGPHRDLEDSFRLCEDSETMLASSIDLGRVYEILENGERAGHVQVVERDGATWEVTSLALHPSARNRGLGRRALSGVEAMARAAGVEKVVERDGDRGRRELPLLPALRLPADARRTRRVHACDRLPRGHGVRRHSPARPDLVRESPPRPISQTANELTVEPRTS